VIATIGRSIGCGKTYSRTLLDKHARLEGIGDQCPFWSTDEVRHGFSSSRKRRSMHVDTVGRPHHFPQDALATLSHQDGKQRRSRRSASPFSLGMACGLPSAALLVLPSGKSRQQRTIRSEKRSLFQFLHDSFDLAAQIACSPHERTPVT